jgi:hypothetical protein
MINIRQKGAGAEREIADDLNYIVNGVYKELGLGLPTKPVVQRNQNQSAVGGKDLVGTFGLAIEVKRQEALSINTWWQQCAASALELKEKPVLLFRQNGKKWRCIILVDLPLPSESHAFITVRAEIDYEAFKSWFRTWVQRKIADVPPSENLVAHPTLFD